MRAVVPRSGRQARSGRQDGAILIVALGVLTLLAVLGATFAQLMSLEKKAVDNYVDAQRMDMLTNSALDVVIARLHDFSNRRSWSAYRILQSTWLFELKDEQDLAHGRADVSDPRVGRWTVYSELAGKRYRFKTKIIDTSSQINLNGRQDPLARMLDNLGRAIEASPRLKREKGRLVTNPFYTEPNRGGNRVRGIDVLLFRQRLEGQRFQSKSQLRQLIGDQNYDLLKDFVTCHGWEDPYTYRAADGLNEVPDLSSGVTTVAGGAGGAAASGARGVSQPPASDNPRLAHEPRFPVNINTAPEEVLIACLQGLAGRRVMPYSQLGGLGGQLVSIDANANILGERLLTGKEESLDVRPRAIFCYTQALQYQHAHKLAQRIMAQRKTAGGTFRAWRTNDVQRQGFEDFIDLLPEDFFPAPGSALIFDPQQPNNRQVQQRVISGGVGNPLARMWQKGTATGVARQIMRNKGLAVHDRFAWYYELAKGVLKANFNPNTRINRYNPNAPAYIAVDKSDMVWANTPLDLRKGHTTEFCFDSTGVYEITTLGEMVDLSKARPSGRATVVGSSAELDTNVAYPFRRKYRTIVKVFDVLRHTNQFQFEKTFKSGTRSSANDRRYTVTWPEPVEALTELYTRGSVRDGRIELAGLLDGQRLNTPVMNRLNFAGKTASTILEADFLTRTPQSITRLRQAMSRGPGIGIADGDQITAALKDAYNAVFSRNNPRSYQEIYRRSRLSSLGLFLDTTSVYIDPLANREAVGNDLMPDGFHSSILRMPHLQNRMVVYPARQRLGEVGVGGGNIKVGASGRGTRGQNVLGNVPYYSGGLAFWMKFDFNADDPVFSGLIGCTQVIREVTTAADFTGSEGTQFFVFKNTEGYLRVVRMYYHQAFPEFGGGGGGDGAAQGGWQLYPDPGTSNDAGGAADANNPILEELDQRKWISRSDILVDIRHFGAHEWHHIAIDWNDQNTAFPIRLYIDFQEMREAVPRKAQQIVDNTANSWVRLNERQPKDGLQVGGIVRHQQVADAGIFKWYTNSSSTTTGGGGVVLTAPTVKRILANATIDEFITYEGTFPQALTYYGRNAPGYFTNQTGTYANVFELPLAPEVDKVVLRSLDWTSYYPAIYTDSKAGSVAQSLRVTTPITCEVSFVTKGAPPSPRPEPWKQPTVDNFVAGREVMRRPGVLRGSNAEVVYKFSMAGSRSNSGNTLGGVVQTPVIDDVTLTYFLPSPRILLQEEAQ